eukprot:gene698-62709_t
MLLQPGLCASAARIFAVGGSGGGDMVVWMVVALAAAGAVASAAVPCAVWAAVLRQGRFRAQRVADAILDKVAARIAGVEDGVLQGNRRRAYILVFGESVWAARGHKDKYFCMQYGIAFDGTKYRYWVLVEMAFVALLSGLVGWRPIGNFTECCVSNIITCVAICLFFLVTAALRPYNAPIENAVTSVINLLNAAAAAMMTAAFMHHGEGWSARVSDAAADVLVAASVIGLTVAAYGDGS